MLNKALRMVLLTGIFLSGIGILLIFLSPELGMSLTENWLRNVGSAETDLYHLIVKHYIMAFLIIGGIFLSIGLTTSIYCFYKSRLLALEKHRSF
ncbi:hypothetical protein [Lysinibacillus odysseyi]|uniref:Uncharacterized protein n=1 Tax=Lysinibacillus odysseyi 34hs-1 = NBRC 100172 TaxID=1220589 RepID=A0A0A3IPI4_9BACI|nr:hypothetical protein [Lysinibacillus odysseyi]KGR85360.1 hypothetical protein CD32_08980 [Lysinibacillus odysseyi 34hs-1 = NBRC 100172]